MICEKKTTKYLLLSCGLVIKGHNSDREICDVEVTRPSFWNCQLQKSFLKTCSVARVFISN